MIIVVVVAVVDLCVSMWELSTISSGTYGSQERASDPLELGLQAAVT